MSKRTDPGLAPMKLPLSNPSAWKDRHRLNFAIMRRGAESGTDDLSSWANYAFNTYYGGTNSFESVAAASFLNAPTLLKTHASREKGRFVSKFGMDAQELLEKTGIAQAVYDDANGTGGAIQDMFAARDARPVKADVDLAFGDFQELRKKGEMNDEELNRYKKGIENFARQYQDMLDVASKIDKSVGERAIKRLSSKPLELGGVPEGTPQSVRFDQTTLTSAINFQDRVDALSGAIDILDANANKLGGRVAGLRKGGKITSSKRSAKNGDYSETKVGISLDRIHREMQGHITNYVGGVFEMGMVMAIAQAGSDMIESVGTAGGDSGSVKLKLPTGGDWTLSKSKTDVSVKTKDFDINISNKAQQYRGSKDATKALDTSMAKLLKFLAVKNEDFTTLQAGFLNESARKPGSGLNKFMGAMLADYAVGGPAGDRIDFMAYQDTIVALYEYLPNIQRATVDVSAGSVGKYQSWIEEYATGTKLQGANYKVPAFRAGAKIIIKTNG